MPNYDAVIVGGSFAGLSAALQIARTGRPVLVVDAGRPRNRFADASHGFFTQDGSNPLAMIETARAQIQRYPNARTLAGEVIDISGSDGSFSVTTASGEAFAAQKLVLAYGVSDTLPDVPGLAERWGATVLHCPYCHGFEFSGRRLGVLQSHPMAAHQALLVADWGPTTLFLNGGPVPDTETAAKLGARGIALEPAPVRTLTGDGGDLSAVELVDGRSVPIDALYVGPVVRHNSDLAERLGCALDETPLGPIIRTDERKRTTVAGIFAAGDIARAPHNATWASADGVAAGVFLHQSLVFEPLAA
ncbi:NAD(P)/FAD-dependent oxidoreductase [Mesorhizobium sp. BR1-1-16]|uniref:NAD(P)/FAD-dependent oxidoreductase n=1 Tax=Mesorhizobium sp. BR1-1-16 TaxID=2876653 RepID=UPI001CD033D9|nr:NAD(P)/FAD-dependent oxidoreductase [Mesorhizobium sp. BR1-1-16]MBZ9938328.1 NAD(P)/FAD-dependent oxidoreductase [Mesorhizobium sp. BR1-1-16]